MPRKSAAARQAETQEPSLPPVLIPPGQAKNSERAAYWIDLLQDGNVENLKAAIQTSEFFSLLQEFPESLWGSRLSIYLYRLEDDTGLMIKNSEKPNYIALFYGPITEDAISKDKRCGGGKYQAWLKLDNKETLIKHTFRIDGAPRVQPGQVVEVAGQVVPIGSAAATEQRDERNNEVAKVIDATSKANESAMGILAHASETAIDMVKAQAAGAAKPEGSGIVDKLVAVLLERALQPPPPAPDPIATLRLAKELFDHPAVEPIEQPEPKDPPISEAMKLVESLAGRPFSELIRGRNPAPAEAQPFAWLAPFAPAIDKLVSILPNLFAQSRAAKDLEFRRAVWARTAPPGTPIPADLQGQPALPPAPAPTPTPAAQPTPAAMTPEAEKMQIVGYIINTVSEGFKRNPRMGYQTAANIDFVCGEAIEAHGLDKLLADEANVTEMVKGTPQLEPLTHDARWHQFQSDFLEYMGDRFGEPEEEGAEKAPGPVPVA